MEAIARTLAALIGIAIGALVAWPFFGTGALRAAPPRFHPLPLTPEARDYAVSALALGELTPPIEALADAELERLVELVARVVQAYAKGDFGAFLALRAGDLEFAQRAQQHRVGELRLLGRELGLEEQDVPADWLGALGAFWRAYYHQPPVARFLPESIKVELHAHEPTGDDADWWSAFEAMRDRRAGFVVEHRLMIPHRRALDEITREERTLSWTDLELEFETRAGPSGRLVARFVRDPAADEWFLHRAVTVHDGERLPEVERCQLIL